MLFISKIENQRLKKAFEAIAENLEHWVVMVGKHQAIATFDPQFSLRSMNSDINYLREKFKLIYEQYVAEDKQGVLDLSLDSLNNYASLVSRIEQALVGARRIAYHYDEELKKCDELNYDTTKWLTELNRKAIDRLFNMTTEDVLAILNDAHLLGF